MTNAADLIEEPTIHSEYLVKKLANSKPNLYGIVKFRVVSDEIKKWMKQPGNAQRPKILDIGCSTSISKEYFDSNKLDFEYCGADYEAAFNPDIVLDATRLSEYKEDLPWQPDMITLLDVLEHLPGRADDIRSTMEQCSKTVAPNGLILAVVPQLYRLDRLKLGHLHYPEHTVRFRLEEWMNIVKDVVDIKSVHGIGYVSIIPYLPMLSPWYKEDNGHGRFFHHMRSNTFEWAPFRGLEIGLTKALGRLPVFRGWCNSTLLVCTPKSS